MSTKIRPLTDGLKKIAHEELNEIEKRLPDDIAALRDWILKQPHLKARTNDQFLLSFLRGCKHSLEKAKTKIDYYYTIRSLMPEFFQNITMDGKFRDLGLLGCSLWLQKPDHKIGPELLLVRMKNFDAERFTLTELLRYGVLPMEYALENIDGSIVIGFVLIIDLEGISMSWYRQVDLSLQFKIGTFIEKALPLRMKGIHILNCPKEGQDLLRILTAMLWGKYKKLLHVHKNPEDLFNFIPKDRLPKEYGGLCGTVEEIVSQNVKEFSAFNNYYLESDQYGVNEELRPHKSIDSKSLFGSEGSFRKLDFD